LPLVVEDGGFEDWGAETEKFVVGVCAGGLATLCCRVVVEEGFIRAARLVGEGIFESSREGIRDLVGWGERYGGEAVGCSFSVGGVSRFSLTRTPSLTSSSSSSRK
jgi:hypothetical protein